MSRPRAGFKIAIGALLIVVAFAVVGSLGARVLFAREAPPVAAPLPAPPSRPAHDERQEAVVVSMEGKVEKSGVDGQWVALTAGQRLLAEDSLRTDVDGHVELAIGDKSRLTVTENTQLKVRELTRAVHQVQLSRGRLVASYDADGERVLRIEDEKGLAVAQTKAAKFSILSNGRALAVATETGTVNLLAAGKTVDISAGQQAFARSGEAPSAATPIPADLLLKIARARGSDPSVCAVVEGTIDPGAQLELDGAPLSVDHGGHFLATVARVSGQTNARFAVTDALGRRVEKTVPCRAAPRAPPMKLKINWTTDAG